MWLTTTSAAVQTTTVGQTMDSTTGCSKAPANSTTTAPTPVVVLAVTLTEPFVEELTDHNSTECKTLETRVVKAVSMTS